MRRSLVAARSALSRCCTCSRPRFNVQRLPDDDDVLYPRFILRHLRMYMGMAPLLPPTLRSLDTSHISAETLQKFSVLTRR